jgi:peptidyl-prolyl cis-trans isomerase SurA
MPDMSYRRVFILFSAVLPLAFVGACSSKPASTPSSADVWATVDGREIRREAVEKTYRGLADPAAVLSEEETMAAKLGVLNEIIGQDLLLAKAKALSLEPTAAEIETAFAERKKGTADDVFQKELTQRGLTSADLKEDIRRELATQKVIEREVAAKISVTEQAIVDHYNANRARFNLAEPAFHLAQIIVTPVREPQITNRQNDDASTPAEATAKVRMLLERLRAGGQFNELAMDFSEDAQTAPQGGNLGLVPASQLAQAGPLLRDAVMKAEPGSVSQVSMGGGHSLVLVVSKEAAGQRDLSTPGVRDSITGELRDRQQQLLQGAYLTVLRNDAQVVNHLAKRIIAERAAAPAPAAPAQPGKK